MRGKLGILAPSAKCPQVELVLGVQKIIQAGIPVRLHKQCKRSHLFFSGTDVERAEAFFEYAKADDISVIWCARGGYGAVRLLPYLDAFEKKWGKPKAKKLLLGYSDSTILMEYVRKRWGWFTLHSPMPTMRKFSLLKTQDWNALIQWIQGNQAKCPWEKTRLKTWANPVKKTLKGTLVGGNLTVLTALIGTPYQPNFDHHFLFLEDVDENAYRIDRMLQQHWMAGTLNKVKAIILGNFLNCKDTAPLVLKKMPGKEELERVLLKPDDSQLQPLRKVMPSSVALKRIFQDLGEKLGVPILFGLPVGHGPEVSPLPLGAEYSLSPSGKFSLGQWDWLGGLDGG